MTNLQGHSLLFDPPIKEGPFEVGDGNYIDDIGAIYNPKALRLFLQLYMVQLICQYIVSFLSVPFDDVENRPIILILSTIYSLLVFCIGAVLLPFASLTIPTASSYRYMLISMILQFLGLALSLAGVIICLNVDAMFLYDYDGYQRKEVKVEVTTYIQVLACISLFLHCLGCFLTLVNTMLIYRALDHLENSIDRRMKAKNAQNLRTTTSSRNLMLKEQVKTYIC